MWIRVGLLALGLTACATVPTDRDYEILPVTDCHGKLHAVDVYYADNAAEACGRSGLYMAIQLPLACSDGKSWVIVSKGAPKWELDHELRHAVDGMHHPWGLSFLEVGECHDH